MPESVFSKKLREIGRSAIPETSGPSSATNINRELGLSEGVGPNEQYEIDRRELGQADFARKYGAAAARERILAAQTEDLDPVAVGQQRREDRRPQELANDITLQTAGGLAQGIAGIANLGLLAVDQELDEARLAAAALGIDPRKVSTRDARQGVAVAADTVNKMFLAGESDVIQNQVELADRTSEARLRDSEIEYNSSNKSLGDKLKRIGRDAIIKGSQFVENPATVSKTTANAVGSLAPSIAVAGGTTAVIRGALSTFGLQGTRVGATLEAIGSAGAIGGVEGQGAYNQVVTEVRGMDYKTLEENSPEFNELLLEGVPPEEARKIVAEAAGITAQKQQTAIASAAGLIVPRFEANPLGKAYSKNALRQVGTLAGETTEEAIQSGSGEFSANVGIQKYADETRDITEGVGEAITEGAVGGFGATGVVQTPAILGNALNESARTLKAGADTVIKHQAERARRKIDDQSTIGEKATTENITAFEQTLRQAEKLQQLAQQASAGDIILSEKEANELLDAVDVQGNLPIDLTDTQSEEYAARTEAFKDLVVEGSRTQTLRRVAKRVVDKNFPDGKTLQAAAEFVQTEIERLQEYAESQITKEAPTEAEKVTGQLASNIISNKVFSRAYDQATEILNESAADPSNTAPVTPREMVLNPVGVNPARVTDEAIGSMEPEVQKAAAVVREIKSPELGETGAVEQPKVRTRASARKELLFNSKRTRYGVIPSFNDMMSMLLKGGINNTRRGEPLTADPQGNAVDARDTFQRLRNLIQHQQNKFEAASQSWEFSQSNPGQNSEQTFDALSLEDGETFRPAKGKIYVNAGSEGSIETFRQIAEDLNTGIRAHNALLAQYPEVYQGQPIPEVVLPENVPERANAQTSQTASTEDQNQQTETITSEENVGDTNVDGSVDSDSSSLRTNQLNFEDLFSEKRETTFKEAIDYLESLETLTKSQKLLLQIIQNSAVFKSKPNMRVRLGSAEEAKAHGTKGWYNPVKDEIVVTGNEISLLLHESIHAISLEILNQRITAAVRKNAQGKKLDQVEKAAFDIREMSKQFLKAKPTSERMAEVQAMMRDLQAEDGGTISGAVRAINEFMAYGLTEARIQRDLAKREYVRPSLASRILAALRSLFGFKPETSMFEELFFNTHTLASDFQTVLAVEREAQRVEARNVEEDPQGTEPQSEETASQTREAPTEESTQETTSEPELIVEPEPVSETAPEPAPVVETSEPASVTPVANATETTTAESEVSSQVAEPETVSEPAADAEILNLEVGKNLAIGLNGESLALKAHSFRPILRYGEDVLQKLDDVRDNLPYLANPKNEASRAELISETEAFFADLVTTSEKWIEGIQEQLQNRLDNQEYKKGLSYREALLNSVEGRPPQNNQGEIVDIFQTQRGLTFNLIDQQSLEDGQPVYDEHLLRLATLAAIDYIMNTENGDGVYKREDIIRALGLPKDTEIEGWMYDLMNFGRTAVDVKEGLAAHIRAFWGAKPNGDVTPSLSRGISEAMADEILDYLANNENEGDYWVQRNSEKRKVAGDQTRTYTAYRLGRHIPPLKSAVTVLQDALTPENSDAHKYRIGQPFSSTPESLQKDKNIPVPEDKQAAIKKQQDTPFYVSPAMKELFTKLGGETLYKILGWKDVSSKAGFFNELHRKAVEGKNASVRREIEQTAIQLDAMQEYADLNGIPLEEVPVYYRWEITLNGRFQMQGFNPQGAKLAREIFTPTKSTIDLSKPGDLTLVYAAIGQATDDFKIENIGLEESALKAREFLARDDYQAALNALKDMDSPDNQKVLQNFFTQNDIEASARLLKALYVANQIEEALAAGQQSLDIDLAMELDGKTNGPITAAIQNNTDSFSPEFLALVRRGGFFIGSRFDGKNPEAYPMSYAEYHKTQEDNADLYEVTGQSMSDALVRYMNRIKEGKGVAIKNQQRNKTFLVNAGRLSVKLLKEYGDIKIEEQDGRPVLVVKRRGTKSPITQNLYGAGAESIAAGLANDMFKFFYEELTEAVRAKNGDKVKEMASIIDELADIQTGSNKDGLYAFQNSLDPSKSITAALKTNSTKKLEEFTFSTETFARVRDALKHTYLPAFEMALGEVVGSTVKQNNDTLVAGTNAHTEIYLAVVRKALAEETERQINEGVIRKGQDISEKDYQAVLNKYRALAPVYDTATSVFDVTGGTQETSHEVERRHRKTGERNFRPRSITLSDQKTGSKRAALDGAGVKILPYNVIANADVAMINGVYNDERVLLDTLAVHDGIEVPVTRLKDMSLIMNEKVAESWQYNTFEPILRSMEATQEVMQDVDVPSETIEIFQESISALQDMVDRRQARIDALNTVGYTVDGAPGAENPYVKTNDRVFHSEKELLDHLNDVMAQKYAEYREARVSPLTAATQIEKEKEGGGALRKALEAEGFDGTPRKLIEVLRSEIQDTDQLGVLENLVNSPAYRTAAASGLSIVLGEQGASSTFNNQTNTITLTNVTGESALHELVHAVTYRQVSQYYQDPSSLSAIADPIQRLESLMEDFISRNHKDDLEKYVANKIRPLLEDGRSAEALNEFMAWSLTNNRLIKLGKRAVTTDPMSQLVALGRKVIEQMRRILGFTSNKRFDHILFNSTLIMQAQPNAQSTSDAILRHQINEDVSKDTPESQRKLRLQNKIANQVTAFLSARNRGDTLTSTAAKQQAAAVEYKQLQLDGLEALSRAQAAGYGLDTPQDVLLFTTLQSIFSADFKTDKLARLEAQKIHEALVSRINVETMLKALGFSTENASPELIDKAQNMVNILRGLAFTDIEGNIRRPEQDARGLSNTLGIFLALAQTSPEVRSILEEIPFEELSLATDIDTASLDRFLSTVADRTIGRLNQRAIDDKTPRSTAAALDGLTEVLLEYEAEAAFQTENRAATTLGKINAKTKSFVERGAARVSDSLNDFSESRNGLLGAAAKVGTNLADILIEDRAKAQAETLTNTLNDPGVPEAIRNLWAELRGITADTAAVLRLVKAAKQTISAVRQEYIEQVPKILNKQFSKAFSEKQNNETNKEAVARKRRDWTHMFTGFGKTDVVSLLDTLGDNTTLKLFGVSTPIKEERNKQLQEARNRLKVELQKLELTNAQANRIADAMYQKAQELGQYQVTNKISTNLLTSAYAIAGLYNEDGLSLNNAEYVALQKAMELRRIEARNETGGAVRNMNEIIRTIDTIASIHALDALPDETHKRIRELLRTEREAIKYALSYAKDLRKMESDKTDSEMARINGYKGHIPNTSRRKYSVIIADKSAEADLIEQGFVRLRDYDSVDKSFNNRMRGKAYYFSAHDKLPTYNQGAMQTVQATYFRVDPATGLTAGPETTGELISGDAAKLINRRLKANPSMEGTDKLIPRFSAEGRLIGYERALAPDMITRLEQSNNYAEALGKWSGRIAEEQMSEGFNKALIDSMYEQYEQDPAKDGYAAFGRVQDDDGNWDVTEELQKDPVWRESYFLVPKEIRRYAEEKFGGPMMIRRDQINNVLGFRSASISDVYKGRGRMNDELRQTLKDIFIATPFIGPDMYKYLTVAEESVQQVVSEVKHVIVVKSGIVLAANTLSNIIQLAGREVPLSYMGKRTRTKFAELEQYKRNEDKKIKLRADALATDSNRKREALLQQIKLIEESEKRMSIWPLIEANQFTTISEGLTDADKAMMDGRFMDWLESKAAELPGPLSTVARYAIVSKDTALYQAMSRAVQYSDFIAKAIYYDFLTEERGISSEDALLKIDHEFINYDLNDSRTRTYLESLGLTWFMNFKLRSLKIAIDLARNNPASTLLGLGVAGVFGLNVGSPVTDNVAGAAADGRLGYSLGPGMIEAGWNLNPWNQIFGR